MIDRRLRPISCRVRHIPPGQIAIGGCRSRGGLAGQVTMVITAVSGLIGAIAALVAVLR